LANPGDLVLSYANQVVAAVGRVAEFAFTAPKPSEFGSTGAYWLDEGWLLPVFWTPLRPPVRPKALLEVLRPLLPRKYSPIRPKTGDGNQSVYLASISRAVFDAVVAAVTIDYPMLLRGGANSLTFQAVKEQLEDRVEQAVREDVGLDSTTRQSVIQARRGQGTFRSNVEQIEKACRLTGITNPTLLIASHIRPWRSCETAPQRLDGMNGLLLTPDADLLFDRGFITFEDDGKVRVSPRFDHDDLRRLGLGESAWRQLGFSEAPMAWQNEGTFTSGQRHYLAYHRRAVYVS
jgi:putative restriction endonuclease